jgi:hypothetical protein
MGVVYRAYDTNRGIEVALKTLHEVEPESLFRFKREFRSLADVSHPHLVSLYDLFAEGERWFFTMELLDAVDFLAHVHSPHAPGDVGARSHDAARTEDAATTVVTPRSRRRPPSPADPVRLRDGLRQLARGVGALHDAGYLHCDIKPSNVLVTTAGRVVLLDFGVIAEAQPARAAITGGGFAGTPAYMSPEQARGEPATEASDWYAVGVVLYQALCGQLPYEGPSEQILASKQQWDPPPPRAAWGDVPDDLNELCAALLARSPSSRASRDDVMRLLGETAIAPVDAPGPSGRTAPLIGRDEHLARLRKAYAQTRTRSGPIVYLHGTSGSGKTTLAQHFLDDVRADREAVVLEGRCYQRESVPYQAIDAIVDELSSYLQEIPRHEANALLPRDVASLAKLFPVLDRVEAVAQARRVPLENPEPHELRRIAFGALRELFGRLAATRPLVLFIDDLQWGDSDSAQLLSAITQPPDAPPMLLLATYRDEDADSSDLLQALLRREARWGSALPVIRIPVGPLMPSEARALATHALAEAGLEVSDEQAKAIAAESAGNPFFVRELAQYARTPSHRGPAEELTLEAVIHQRVQALPDAARRLLEVVAVAGKLIAQSIAQQAAGVPAAECPHVIRELSGAQLVRSSGARDGDRLTCYHDRIRLAVADGLDAERLRATHARLAASIAAADEADAETLLEHYHAAGDTDAAAAYAIRAAEQAAAALAFDRAARLYQLALELRAPVANALVPLRNELAGALVNAGRAAEGADVYLAAAEQRTDLEALELRRRAAEQHLKSGHTDRGLETLATVLRQLGLRMPSSPLRAVPAWLLLKARLRLRGLRYRARDATEVSPLDRLRIDTCLAVATGLAYIDPARAGVFGVRHALLALKTGDVPQVALAFAVEGAYVAAQGRRAERRARYLLERAEQLAREVDQPYVTAFTLAMRAFEAQQRGRFPESYEVSLRADQMLRDHCTGVTWARKLAELNELGSLMFMGEYGRLAQRVPARLAQAEQHGDQFAISNLRTLYVPIVDIVRDDLDGARRELSEAERQLSPTAHVQRGFAMLAGAMTDLYGGDGGAAYERCRRGAGSLARSLVDQAEVMRGLIWHFRGSGALRAAAHGHRDRRVMLRVAGRDARRLVRTGTPWLVALGLTNAAGVAAARGDIDRARQLLVDAVQRCDEQALGGWAAAARCQLGRLLGGDEGRTLVEHGERWLVERGTANPARMIAALAPGFPE